MKSCFFIKPYLNSGHGSGGNIVPSNRISVRRFAAIGDVLSATVVADKLHEQGFEVSFQCHADIQQLIRRHPTIVEVTNAYKPAHVVLDGAYEKDPLRRRKHFTQTWIDSANSQLARIGINLGKPINCRPRIIVTELEKHQARERFKHFPRPWVFICPRSDSYAVRQVPDGIWKEAADKIQGTKMWVGRHPAPVGFIDLKADLDQITQWLSVADLLLTIDSGPIHIGAALGVPIVAIEQSSSPSFHLNDQTDFETIANPDLSCLNCCRNLCPLNADIPPCQNIDPSLIADAANRKLKYLTQDAVSAVIPIFKPEVEVLNRCLSQLVDQVDEIIVSLEALSVLPTGYRTHPKIRYVKTWRSGIGFGPNMNHGVRHSSNRWLLLINDDVFLPPGTVDKLMERARLPNVGVVAHQLRFLDGTIYPVAMQRAPGDRDWRHIDYRATHSSINSLTELDNCCGASIIVPRKAFYEIGGFDEGYFMYCEDNDLVLRIRKAGYKAIFDPNITGTHINGESSKKVGRAQNDMISESGKRFHARWDKYLAWNRDRPIGNFDCEK